ncbi:Aste57867_2350 [Aphanomyces stellatus]|uniref:Aste57867_2350 protein n=1 Tax=Aphanomyces stellatus TaxID=120398 RepID=A0A485KCJ5_9STRA|nr:hypothetical protein As57867_002345 [Aphanomyces stellatus]VFT79551.1 Aste57867_2350 [Aphanomyces stellatus]
MPTSTARRLLEEIFASKRIQCAISLTGGGGNVAGDLLGTCGASSTLLELTLPYYQQSLLNYLNLPADIVKREAPTKFSFSSQEVAMLMAKESLERARRLVPLEDAATCVGVGCTAALVSLQPRKGSHRAYVTLHSAHGIHNYKLEMHKGARSRKEEDETVGNLIVLALANAANIDTSHLATEITSHDDDVLTVEPTTTFDNSFPDVLTSFASSIAFLPFHDTLLRDMPWRKMLVVPGSFNPIHDGHVRFAAAAQRLLHSATGDTFPPLFELSIQNADKGTVNVEDIETRVRGIVQDRKQAAVLTNASLFLDKAALFPSCAFAVGADTAVRLVDLKYYGNDPSNLWLALSKIAAVGCCFVVAGRLVGDMFVSAEAAVAQVPPPFRSMFHAIPEAEFRLDLSSTQLRQQAAL